VKINIFLANFTKLTKKQTTTNAQQAKKIPTASTVVAAAWTKQRDIVLEPLIHSSSSNKNSKHHILGINCSITGIFHVAFI
jgi:hypothetical protein